MSQKDEELLLPSAQHHSLHFPLALAISSAIIETPDGEYLLEEAGKRALRVAVQADLTEFGMAQAAVLKEHAARVFSRECAALDQVAASAQDSASSKYIGQFHHLLKDHMADQLLEMDAEAMRQMRHDLLTPLPTEKPKDPRNFLVRFVQDY